MLLAAATIPAVAQPPVTNPPASLQLHPFYAKYISADGLPVVGSEKVPDDALRTAAGIVAHMLAKRPDILRALVRSGVRVAVMAQSELTTDIPEHSDLTPKEYWDRRARGLGATVARPAVSCAEENLLGYGDDPYRGESILIHEFAHTIHEMALNEMDPGFEPQLKRLYDAALAKGVWQRTYAAESFSEYWAEGVQSWFDANLQADPPDGIHNHVNTRAELRAYDPELAALIARTFRRPKWRWTPPAQRP